MNKAVRSLPPFCRSLSQPPADTPREKIKNTQPQKARFVSETPDFSPSKHQMHMSLHLWQKSSRLLAGSHKRSTNEENALASSNCAAGMASTTAVKARSTSVWQEPLCQKHDTIGMGTWRQKVMGMGQPIEWRIENAEWNGVLCILVPAKNDCNLNEFRSYVRPESASRYHRCCLAARRMCAHTFLAWAVAQRHPTLYLEPQTKRFGCAGTTEDKLQNFFERQPSNNIMDLRLRSRRF